MPAPRISVVIAAYRPGQGFDRVIRSLDAQTLPQDEFETIVVDDGSPDDTFERLTALAATRPNLRVERIENSGWPSRPRNVGTALARGEWVLYMDHDDSLYPDALRRMAEFAAATRADVLSPKESKTSDAWWGMPALRDGNVPDALVDGGIDRLLPMVPHKLYRRAFLESHAIRFPEGRRQLWEDIYVNVEAWRHAERVAVLADTPAYLWWASGSNNSKTYGPRTQEFWDRLDELFAFVDEMLDGDEYADARRSALLHQYRGRVLTRLSRNLRRASAAEAELGMTRARAIQQRYIPEQWDEALEEQSRARAVLLRTDRPDLLVALSAIDTNTASRVTATEARWAGGALHLRLESRWVDKSGHPIGLRRSGERLVRDLPPDLMAALPADVVDFTDTIDRYELDLGVRDRTAQVTWRLTNRGEAQWAALEDDRVAPTLVSQAVLDPRTAAMDRPLEASVQDLVAELRWAGATRASAVLYGGASAPATIGDLPAVAYRTMKGSLAVDLSGRLRNPAADGGPAPGRVPGTLRGLSLPLPRVRSAGRGTMPAAMRLVSSADGAEVLLPGVLHADRDGARLDLAAPGRVPNGRYQATFQVGGGEFLGKRPAQVHGGVLTLLERAAPAASPASRWPASRWPAPRWPAGAQRVRTLAGRVVREVRRRVRG